MHELARLQELITRHAGAGLTPTALPGVSVLRATAPTQPLGDMAEPAVAVIAQGVKETALNGHVFTYGPGRFLIVPVELPLVGHIAQASPTEPLLAFVLRLRPEKIAALLAETAPVSADRTAVPPSSAASTGGCSAPRPAATRSPRARPVAECCRQHRVVAGQELGQRRLDHDVRDSPRDPGPVHRRRRVLNDQARPGQPERLLVTPVVEGISGRLAHQHHPGLLQGGPGRPARRSRCR